MNKKEHWNRLSYHCRNTHSVDHCFYRGGLQQKECV
jgi:hypothetical protein